MSLIDPKTILSLSVEHLIPAAENRTAGSGLDAKSITELANSIKEQGIISPLTVRPHPTEKGRYEIIAGERRWTAAQKAGLTAVPCVVHDCSEFEARELRIIENLQRAGLHEIEEARNYQALLDEKDEAGAPRYDIKRLAVRLGKSPAFVYARVKLLRMPELAQEAMLKGRLNASVALLLCRIPDPKLAHRATCEVLDRYSGQEERALDPETEAMSYRDAKRHVAAKYMKRLKDAPFDPESATLVPPYDALGQMLMPGELPPGVERCGGGACGDCPCRTGNMKATFPDAESTDVCTNTACYAKKVGAAQKALAAECKEKGQTLLKPREAENLFNSERTDLSDSARKRYVPLNETVPGKRKTWGEMLEKAGTELEIVVAKVGAKTVPLVSISDAVAKAAKDVGVKLTVPKAVPAPKVETAEERARRRKVGERTTELYEAAMQAALRIPEHAEEVRAQVGAALLQHSRRSTGSAKQIRKLDNTELFARLYEEELLRGGAYNYDGELRDEAIADGKLFGVDLKALEQQAEAEVPTLPTKAAKPEEAKAEEKAEAAEDEPKAIRPSKKCKLSADERANILAAQKARWAKIRAEKKSDA